MGVQLITDQARAFTASCVEVISGGYILGLEGTDEDVVTSTGGYVATDIKVKRCDSATNVVGIAAYDAASGTTVDVLMQGLFILQAGSSAISGGQPVKAMGYEDMAGVIPMNDAGSSIKIGTGLSTGTALTGYAIVRINI